MNKNIFIGILALSAFILSTAFAYVLIDSHQSQKIYDEKRSEAIRECAKSHWNSNQSQCLREKGFNAD